MLIATVRWQLKTSESFCEPSRTRDSLAPQYDFGADAELLWIQSGILPSQNGLPVTKGL